MKQGTINLYEGLFFIGKEISRSSDIVKNRVKFFLSFIISEYGIVRSTEGEKKTNPNPPEEKSFALYVDDVGNLRILENSLAIGSDLNFIFASKGDYVKLPKSYWNNNTYAVYVSYAPSQYEEGMCRITRIDNTHGIVEWDTAGSKPDFSKSYSKTAPPYMVSFKKGNGDSTSNDQSYYVTNADSEKMYIEGSSIQDEYGLRFSILGSFVDKRYTNQPYYVYDGHIFTYYRLNVDGTFYDSNTKPVGFKIAEISSNEEGVHKIVKNIKDVNFSIARLSEDAMYYIDPQNIDLSNKKYLSIINTLRRRDVDLSGVDIPTYLNSITKNVNDFVISNDFVYIYIKEGKWKKVALENIS